MNKDAKLYLEKVIGLTWNLSDAIIDLEDALIREDDNSHSLVEMCDIVRK